MKTSLSASVPPTLFHFRQKNSISVSIPQISIFVFMFSFHFLFFVKKSESFRSTFVPSGGDKAEG
jgi:hypothetical protein